MTLGCDTLVRMEGDDRSSVPSAWQAAIDFGIDVTLLAANLERTPAERLRELVAMNRFQAAVQARTVPEELRRRIDAEELAAKFGALLAAAPGRRSDEREAPAAADDAGRFVLACGALGPSDLHAVSASDPRLFL